jgi:hypothetical protein
LPPEPIIPPPVSVTLIKDQCKGRVISGHIWRGIPSTSTTPTYINYLMDNSWIIIAEIIVWIITAA